MRPLLPIAPLPTRTLRVAFARRRTSVQRLGLLGAFTMAAACGGDLPIRADIVSTRVLAVRVEVTQPLVPDSPDAASRCEALPGETITLTPLVVDPQGPVDLPLADPLWIACDAPQGVDVFACLREALPTSVAELPECVAPEFPPEAMNSLNGFAAPTPEEPVSPCRIPTAATGGAQYVVPLSANAFLGGHLEVTMIGQTPGGTPTRTCADALLAGKGKVPDDCLLAVQRVGIGPIGQLLLLAEQLGIDLGIEPPNPEDVPDADRNPRITAADIQEVDDLYDAEAVGPVLNVPYGSSVGPVAVDTYHRVRIAARPDDLQTYPIPSTDTESGTEDKVEYYQAQWFTSFGALSSDNSDDPENRTVWGILEDAADKPQSPADGEATLYYVLRDNRGGVTWWWFRVLVLPQG